jgi:hypothetical protein
MGSLYGRTTASRAGAARASREASSGALGAGAPSKRLEAPVDHGAEPDAAEEARRQRREDQRDEETLIDDADAVGEARQHNAGASSRRQAAIPEWPAIRMAGARVMLDLAVMVPGDHAYGARWNPGQHEILYLVLDDSRAADVQHALVLVRRQRAEARRRSRSEDHRLLLTRHAPPDRVGDGLHRGDTVERIVPDRGLLGEHEDRGAVEDRVASSEPCAPLTRAIFMPAECRRARDS